MTMMRVCRHVSVCVCVCVYSMHLGGSEDEWVLYAHECRSDQKLRRERWGHAGSCQYIHISLIVWSDQLSRETIHSWLMLSSRSYESFSCRFRELSIFDVYATRASADAAAANAIASSFFWRRYTRSLFQIEQRISAATILWGKAPNFYTMISRLAFHAISLSSGRIIAFICIARTHWETFDYYQSRWKC